MSYVETLTPNENLVRAIDALAGAKARAAERAVCPHCGRAATLAVDVAERDVIEIARRIAGERS